jgi:hypothetical protein
LYVEGGEFCLKDGLRWLQTEFWVLLAVKVLPIMMREINIREWVRALNLKKKYG